MKLGEESLLLSVFYSLHNCEPSYSRDTHTSAGPVEHLMELSSLGWIPVENFIVRTQHTAVMLKTCGVCMSVLTVVLL